MSHQKSVFLKIAIIASVIFLVLPFWNSFQDLLTRIVMKISFYRKIQDIVVPHEMGIVGRLFNFLNLPINFGSVYFSFIDKQGINQAIYLIWNCVGWQTLVLFLLTLVTGFSKGFSLFSKIESLAIGILGTYLINILRIILVVLVYYYFGRGVGIIFHDYFSSILTISWLVFFWWLSYKYVLIDRSENATT